MERVVAKHMLGVLDLEPLSENDRFPIVGSAEAETVTLRRHRQLEDHKAATGHPNVISPSLGQHLSLMALIGGG